VALVLALVFILLWVSVPAFASMMDSVLISVTPYLPGWSPPEEDPEHSYGIYLEAGEAHPAWNLAAVLPYVMAALGILLMLRLEVSIGGIVMGAILIILTANFIPIVWEMIP